MSSREEVLDLEAIRKRAAWHDATVGEDRCKCTVACDDRRLLLAEIERLKVTQETASLNARIYADRTVILEREIERIRATHPDSAVVVGEPVAWAWMARKDGGRWWVVDTSDQPGGMEQVVARHGPTWSESDRYEHAVVPIAAPDHRAGSQEES